MPLAYGIMISVLIELFGVRRLANKENNMIAANHEQLVNVKLSDDKSREFFRSDPVKPDPGQHG